MAGEIQIALKLYPQRTTNPNASWDQLTQSTNAHQAGGWRFKNGEVADLNATLSQPIPTSINATPAAKVKLHWVTDSATGNDVKWFVYVVDRVYNTDTTDPAAWDDSLTVVDTNLGSYVEHECEVSITTAMIAAGRNVRLLIRRDSTDGADTLAADVLLTDAILVADEA